MALLSCGPIANALWELGAGELYAGLGGAVAGILGIYLVTVGLPRSLATAIRAAGAWGQASSKLRDLWVRVNDGEDVWQEYRHLDAELLRIDEVTAEDLSTDESLVQKAWQGAERALAHPSSSS